MTSIVLAPRLEDPTSDTEPIVSTGWRYRVRVSKVRTDAGQWVLPEWPLGGGWQQFTGVPVDLQLDPLDSIPYELHVEGPADPSTRTVPRYVEYRFVRTGTAPGAKWETLDQTSGPGSSPAAPSELEARVAALEAALGSVSGGATNLAGISDMSAFARGLNTDTAASAARSRLGAADDSTVVHLTGTETVTGAKTINTLSAGALSAGALTATTSATVPTPTASGHAATKGYVDSTVSAGAPDATTGAKGLVQLAGDLAGTAASPSVQAVRGVAIDATAPTAGQVLVAQSGTAAQWQGSATSISIAGMPPCSTVTVTKDATTGFWPASWDGSGNPVYTGGSSSAGVRPTSRADIVVRWKGADPSPAIVSSGTGGMRDGIDERLVTP